MLKYFYILGLCTLALSANAQTKKGGGITPDDLKKIESQHLTRSEEALANALAGNEIKKIAVNRDNRIQGDTHFTYEVKSKGITDQKSSGRCWLFTGLNVMRAATIAKFNLGDFSFSQNYNFFYDQLEKSNLFLQTVIDNAKKPMDDKLVDWLFHNPLSDGGQFTGIIDIISKYGVVPESVMPETYSSNHTSQMSDILQTKLREYGLTLRKAVADNESPAQIQQKKVEMLSTIYHILTLCLGNPPSSFTWTLYDDGGRAVSTKTYTPLSFYDAYVGKDLKGSYVMLMNDPTRPYYRTYEIDMDRHTYDGENWRYVNVPMSEIDSAAIASLKDSVMAYMSCDVGKFLNKETGVLDLNNYDFGALFSTTFPMDKAQRIRSFASASTHAMTMKAVDIDEQGKPRKWMVENSWGPDYGFKGKLIITNDWLDNYLFRFVAERRFVSPRVLEALKTKPTLLPAWDPLFTADN